MKSLLRTTIRRASSSDAFSLVELLVSMAVLLLLVVMLMGIVDGATKLWRDNENRAESYREVRAALSLIATEIRSIHPSSNPAYFNMAPGPSAGDGTLAFVAEIPLSAQEHINRSELCAVGYFLAKGRVSDIGMNTPDETWNLYRYLLQSNDVFAEMTNASPNFWPPFAAGAPKTEILARNVRSFSARGFVQDAGGGWQEWVGPSPASPLPHLVEVRMETVDNETGKRFRGDIKRASPELVAGSQLWITRVALPRPVD